MGVIYLNARRGDARDEESRACIHGLVCLLCVYSVLCMVVDWEGVGSDNLLLLLHSAWMYGVCLSIQSNNTPYSARVVNWLLLFLSS